PGSSGYSKAWPTIPVSCTQTRSRSRNRHHANSNSTSLHCHERITAEVEGVLQKTPVLRSDVVEATMVEDLRALGRPLAARLDQPGVQHVMDPLRVAGTIPGFDLPKIGLGDNEFDARPLVD